MKNTLLVLITCMGFSVFSQYTSIPDQNFESALIKAGYDSGEIDGKVLTENISTVKSLDINDLKIKSLSGIEDFKALTYLSCAKNELTTIDLSKNINLYLVFIKNNQLSTLDLSKNTKLAFINCDNNQIGSLDFSSNSALLNIKCANNEIMFLDFPNNSNSKLNYVDCSSNEIFELNTASLPSISSLNCSSNELTQLDFSKNYRLKKLDCSNNKLRKLNLANGKNSYIESINTLKNPKLKCFKIDGTYGAFMDTKIQKDDTTQKSNNCE